MAENRCGLEVATTGQDGVFSSEDRYPPKPASRDMKIPSRRGALRPLVHPPPRVVEHLQPGRVFAQAGRMPRHLHTADDALWVRHHDGESAIGGGEADDTLWRTVGVGRIARRHATTVVDLTQRQRRVHCACEFGPALAV